MHNFKGKWITDDEFFELEPRNVFFRQLDKVSLSCKEHTDCHILFRKNFSFDSNIHDAKIYISADDYYKLYINGVFVCQGPSPSYHSNYNYNVVDVSHFLKKGKNTVAVHTLYQGLINRVWQSGDNRHGLILDLDINGETVISTDETFKTSRHTAYKQIGITGYSTQFLEMYDSNALEVGFEKPDFDDSNWVKAKIHKYADYTLTEQKSKMLVFEKVFPKNTVKNSNTIIYDFGSTYVGYLCLTAIGKSGNTITVRCGQELNDDGSVRYSMRCNCRYDEKWVLTDGKSSLEWFDYKSFRYAEIIIPDGCEITEVFLNSRHYPFELKAEMNPDFGNNNDLKKIWNLCVYSQKYGIQEVIQDCMEREKGFYMGDGCYSALAHLILTKDDSMVRKLIDDGFYSSFITDGLVTCLDCSLMQEIAEYPLMLISLVWWHYKFTGDKDYLAKNYPKVISLLESYRKNFEKNGLLSNLDKWCVVEWPDNFRDGYDADLTQGVVCTDTHIAINAYYYEAVSNANRMAKALDIKQYRDTEIMKDIFIKAFYIPEKNLFRDKIGSSHISLIGNVFPFSFSLCPDSKFKQNFIEMLKNKKFSALSFFTAFPALMGFVRNKETKLIKESLLDKGAWLRMLSEGATTTFEGWGKDVKWNTSLFHLTYTYAAIFLSDVNLDKLFN